MDEDNYNDEKKVKEAVKKGAKKAGIGILKAIKTTKWALPLLGGLVLIILAAGIINIIPYSIMSWFNSLFPGGASGNGTHFSDLFVQSTSDISTLVTIDANGHYQLKVSNFAEKVVEGLENSKVQTETLGFSTDDSFSEKEFENLINDYINAEIKTSLIKIDEGGVDGIIRIKRKLVDSSSIIDLKYKKYSDFMKLVNEVKSSTTGEIEYGDELFEVFSIDPDTFELCIARKRSNEVWYDENNNVISGGKKLESAGDGGNQYVFVEKIPYQNYIEDYVLPFNFFLSLHNIAQDIDFMKELTNMATGYLNDDAIVLTYIDHEGYNEENIQYTGIELVKKEYETTGDPKEQEEKTITNIGNSNIYEYVPDLEIEYFKKTINTYSGQLYVTYADTWLSSTNKLFVDGNPVSETSQITENIVGSKDNFEKISSKPPYRDESLDADVTETTYRWIIKETNNKFSNKEPWTIDDNSEIKVDKLVDLIRKYPKVESNLATAPSNLFYLLQQNTNTQKLEKIMRYVLYMLNDIDYGVTMTELEEMFGISFSKANTNGIKEYLAQFKYGKEGIPIYEFEGIKFYKVYTDDSGILKVGLSGLEIEQYMGVEAQIQHKGKIEKAIINNYIGNIYDFKNKYTQSVVDSMNIYVEKEVVDIITDHINESEYSAIEQTDLVGLNLWDQQVYALMAVKQDFGELPIIDGRSFKQVYQDGIQGGIEEGSPQHNMYIWTNWWCKLGGNDARKITDRDAQFETYLKGIIDLSVSDAGPAYARTKYIHYTNDELSRFSAHRRLATDRTQRSEEEIFELETNAGTFERSNEPYICGYYYSTDGRKFTIFCQSKIKDCNETLYSTHLNDADGPGWASRCNRTGSTIIASGYSKDDPTTLIRTMNMYYDETIPTDKYWNLYGLTSEYRGATFHSRDNYIKKVREQLMSGGYALVWMNHKNYTGKSGHNYTGNGGIHWVSIIDYKVEDGREQIVVADSSGAYWRDIDEFEAGVTYLYLIGEQK